MNVPRLAETDMFGREGRYRYHPPEGLLPAANVALALERPLLLTGEPGCGKSEFAWAAASALSAFWRAQGIETPAEPLVCHVRSDTRAKDLLYSYDALARFGDAHHGGDTGAARAREAANYVALQPLGRALVSPAQRVVLLDEIDKAQRDLPNDLLRELERFEFEIPEIPESARPATGDPFAPARNMCPPGGARRPFVVITSNVERQLPEAFLRRCVFWHIAFPSDEKLDEILVGRIEGGLLGLDRSDVEAVRTLFQKVRARVHSRRPGTAELLDWIGALSLVYPDKLPIVRQLAREQGVHLDELPGKECLVKQRTDGEKRAG